MENEIDQSALRLGIAAANSFVYSVQSSGGAFGYVECFRNQGECLFLGELIPINWWLNQQTDKLIKVQTCLVVLQEFWIDGLTGELMKSAQRLLKRIAALFEFLNGFSDFGCVHLSSLVALCLCVRFLGSSPLGQ